MAASMFTTEQFAKVGFHRPSGNIIKSTLKTEDIMLFDTLFCSLLHTWAVN